MTERETSFRGAAAPPGPQASHGDGSREGSPRKDARQRYLLAMEDKEEKRQTTGRGITPARQGRTKQRFEDDVRLCAGVLPLTREGHVVVISSAKHKDQWILPKGGWEEDETVEEAARRECYEEGGLRGELREGHVDVTHVNSHGVTCKTRFFVMDVVEVLDLWPEMHRRRRVVSVAEARELLRKGTLQRALDELTSKASQAPRGDAGAVRWALWVPALCSVVAGRASLRAAWKR